jgi:hypothetical protein
MNALAKKLLSANSVAQRMWALRIEGLKQSHLCYNPYCPTSAQAIKSHILQKNGILNHVSEDIGNGKEIIELKYSDYFKQNKTNSIYSFVKSGVTKSSEVTFWGFCSDCDRNLFAPLEVGTLNLTSKRNQDLLAYRALMRDICAQEYNIEFYSKVRTDTSVTSGARMFARDGQLPQALKLSSNYELRQRFEDLLFNKSSDSVFNYIVFSLPLVRIAHSTIIGGPHMHTLDSIKANSLLAWKPDYANKASLPSYIYNGPLGAFNLVPTANELIVIIGYDEKMDQICNIPINDIVSLNIEDKFKLISDILITRGESWCIAPSLYTQLKRMGRDKVILDAINEFFPNEKKHLNPSINMFDGLGLF